MVMGNLADGFFFPLVEIFDLCENGFTSLKTIKSSDVAQQININED